MEIVHSTVVDLYNMFHVSHAYLHIPGASNGSPMDNSMDNPTLPIGLHWAPIGSARYIYIHTSVCVCVLVGSLRILELPLGMTPLTGGSGWRARKWRIFGSFCPSTGALERVGSWVGCWMDGGASEASPGWFSCVFSAEGEGLEKRDRNPMRSGHAEGSPCFDPLPECLWPRIGLPGRVITSRIERTVRREGS